jgi:UDPglucose--hexose-1-phosphate uridylyltransferase
MSEFRQDITSGDWVIVAPGRAKRPEELVKKKEPRKPAPKKTCPFEDLMASGNWPPRFVWPSSRQSASAQAADGKDWKIAVIKNKYPALSHEGGCAVDGGSGIYPMKTGTGEHEIVIGHDHMKNFADIDRATAGRLFEIFQLRHRALAENGCLLYASTFANWGPSAGASVWHPHYQILAMPIIPPHIVHSLAGSAAYFRKHKRLSGRNGSTKRGLSPRTRAPSRSPRSRRSIRSK